MSSDEQRELAEQLAYVIVPNWAGPLPADLLHLDTVPARLGGVVHSLFVELQGDGGVMPHRLSPKGNPDLDLLDIDQSPRYAYPPDDTDRAKIPADTLTLIDAIRAQEIARHDATGPLSEVIAGFVTAILAVIEAGYQLVPQRYDEDGVHLGEGDDIAPGLVEAFREAAA
ncbi:hypothetical protein [Catenuloplanes japonicus]|uniref:hypothetical protein n=1 Tax=Catenuloplanes japonicus TaxID=33876 RepID=UPI000B1A1A60|nr:hypothetical protein [Catenuloplanes japonicus]